MVVRILTSFASSRLARRVREALGERNVLLIELERGEATRSKLRGASFDLALLEIGAMKRRGAPSIADIRESPDHPDVIVFTERDDAELRARMLAAGALAVFHRDLSDGALRDAIVALVDRHGRSAVLRLRSQRAERACRLSDFASKSPMMGQFMELVRRVAAAETSLLIGGETGVGKEHLARAIHEESRPDGPFIAINCAAIPEALLENELFGHVEGAFTGASRARRGYFELADRGTLFLDEIGDLPQHVQVKLLRVLQEHRIQAVGSEIPIEVDVRVIAASNRDLHAEVRAGRFRADLYYRLAVVALVVPELRRRREDIPLLVQSYVDHYRVRLNRPVTAVSDEALALLVRYSWPGNVRELINVIERAVLLALGGTIEVSDLPEEIRREAAGRAPEPGPAEQQPSDLLELPWLEARERLIDEFERRYFDQLLTRFAGRIGDAARHAGIAPRSLHERMKHLGLRKESFKARQRSAGA